MQEREDVEAQLKVVEEKLTQALTGQAALQADLDQTRSQAGDTIRTLDSERQQLNTAVRRYLLSCVGFISILWGVFSWSQLQWQSQSNHPFFCLASRLQSVLLVMFFNSQVGGATLLYNLPAVYSWLFDLVLTILFCCIPFSSAHPFCSIHHCGPDWVFQDQIGFFYLRDLPWLEACWNTEISAGWEKRLKSCTVYLMQRNTTLPSHDVWHQRRIRFYFNLTECWTLSSILFMRKGMYWVGDLWAVDGGSLLLHQSFICFY